ncbi:MAG: NBR1-Ig-like domain-containing protein [Anaerolineales bacterium]
MRSKLLLWALLALLLSGCLPSLAPASPAAPDLNAVQTVIAATAGAAATQTAAFLPSPTPLPSATPTVTITPTMTLTPTPIIVFPTFTPLVLPSPIGGGGGGSGSGDGGGSADYACVLLDQTPRNGTVMRPQADFDAVWTLRNSGTKTWDSGSVDFIYLRGDKIHKQAGYDLPKDVAPGKSINLGADMLAPRTEGTYTTFWGLRRGNDIFCEVYLTIIVRP